MKTLLVTLYLLLLVIFSFAQNNQIIWEKTYGGEDYDGAYKIISTSDSGYLVAGYAYSNDGDVHDHYGADWYGDAWFLKLNENGDTLWTKSLGGTYTDYANDILESSTGEFYAIIKADSDDNIITNPIGQDDYWVVKLSSNGDLIWEKSFGGTSDDIGTSILEHFDGNIIISGYSSSQNGDISSPISTSNADAWIIKIDTDGNKIWDKSYGGTDSEEAFSIVQTLDSGLIITGNTWSNNGDFTNNQGLRDLFVIKTDTAGNIEWAETYGGTSFDYAYAIVSTSDSGYVVTGKTSSSNGDFTTNEGGEDVFAMKLDKNGTVLWQKTYGGSGYESAYSIIETSVNNYTIAAYTNSTNGAISNAYQNYDIWMLNISQTGGLNWEQSFGGDSLDAAYSVIQNMDGTYTVAGFTQSNEYDVSGVHGTQGEEDVWIMKIACAPPVSQEICMVTVDETSTKNKLVWNKPSETTVDSILIYRDITGNYTYVGAVSQDSISEFIDETNGINPNITSYRYKISTKDTTGFESPLSNFHETIHLTTNQGTGTEINLIWDNYEGFSFTKYYILRDTIGQGDFIRIDSVSASNNTYTDLQTTEGTNNYIIETVPPFGACSATKAKAASYNSSRSNKSQGIINTTPLSAQFIADNTIISTSEIVNFSDQTIGNPTEWKWYFEGGFPATSIEQNPQVVYLSSGCFYVALKSTNSFGSDSTKVNCYINVNPLSIDNNEKLFFETYPNPINTELYLLSNTQGKYTIKDAIGKTCLQGNVYKGKNNLDLNELNRGIYWISLQSEKETQSKKIIVQ